MPEDPTKKINRLREVTKKSNRRFTHDPNDAELKAYEDSLNVYNTVYDAAGQLAEGIEEGYYQDAVRNHNEWIAAGNLSKYGFPKRSKYNYRETLQDPIVTKKTGPRGLVAVTKLGGDYNISNSEWQEIYDNYINHSKQNLESGDDNILGGGMAYSTPTGDRATIKQLSRLQDVMDQPLKPTHIIHSPELPPIPIFRKPTNPITYIPLGKVNAPQHDLNIQQDRIPERNIQPLNEELNPTAGFETEGIDTGGGAATSHNSPYIYFDSDWGNNPSTGERSKIRASSKQWQDIKRKQKLALGGNITDDDPKKRKRAKTTRQLAEEKLPLSARASRSVTPRFVRERLINSIYPYGYDEGLTNTGVGRGIKEFGKSVVSKESGETSQRLDLENPAHRNRYDALRMYVDLPQHFETFSESEHRPTKGKDAANPKTKYYKFTDTKAEEKYVKAAIVHGLFDKGKRVGSNVNIKDIFSSGRGNSVMNTGTVGLGKDDDGHYISYFDEWDLAGKDAIPGIRNVVGRPFNIYGRVYITDSQLAQFRKVKQRTKALIKNSDLQYSEGVEKQQLKQSKERINPLIEQQLIEQQYRNGELLLPEHGSGIPESKDKLKYAQGGKIMPDDAKKKYKGPLPPNYNYVGEEPPVLEQAPFGQYDVSSYWNDVNQRQRRAQWLQDFGTSALTVGSQFRQPTQGELQRGRQGGGDRAGLFSEAGMWFGIDALTGGVTTKLSNKLMPLAAHKAKGAIPASIRRKPISEKLTNYSYDINSDLYNVKSIDDIFKFTDDELREATLFDKRAWKQIIDMKGEKEAFRIFGSKVFSRGHGDIYGAKSIPVNPEQSAVLNAARTRQQDWLNSNEWLRRRMKATGESEGKARIARQSGVSLLKKTDVTLKDMPKGSSLGGIQYYDELTDTPKVLLSDKANLPNSANHEFIHSSNAKAREYFFKGIDFPPLNEASSAAAKGNISYLNNQAEKQVRGVRALNYLEDKGIWAGGEITEEHIDILKRGTFYGGDVPQDVRNLITNISKENLKTFLNDVYSVSGATYLGLKAVDNPQDNTQQYAQGGKIMPEDPTKRKRPEYNEFGEALYETPDRVSNVSGFAPMLFDMYRKKVPESYRALLPGFSDVEDLAYLQEAFSKQGNPGEKGLAVGALALPYVGSKALKKLKGLRRAGKKGARATQAGGFDLESARSAARDMDFGSSSRTANALDQLDWGSIDTPEDLLRQTRRHLDEEYEDIMGDLLRDTERDIDVGSSVSDAWRMRREAGEVGDMINNIDLDNILGQMHGVQGPYRKGNFTSKLRNFINQRLQVSDKYRPIDFEDMGPNPPPTAPNSLSKSFKNKSVKDLVFGEPGSYAIPDLPGYDISKTGNKISISNKGDGTIGNRTYVDFSSDIDDSGNPFLYGFTFIRGEKAKSFAAGKIINTLIDKMPQYSTIDFGSLSTDSFPLIMKMISRANMKTLGRFEAQFTRMGALNSMGKFNTGSSSKIIDGKRVELETSEKVKFLNEQISAFNKSMGTSIPKARQSVDGYGRRGNNIIVPKMIFKKLLPGTVGVYGGIKAVDNLQDNTQQYAQGGNMAKKTRMLRGGGRTYGFTKGDLSSRLGNETEALYLDNNIPFGGEQFGFGGWLEDDPKSISRALKENAGTIGTIGGGLIGGPAGAAIGGALGGAVSGIDGEADEVASSYVVPTSLAKQNYQRAAHGGDLSKLTTYNGPKHTEGGIDLGGLPVEVEGGETRFKDMIFSDQTIITKQMVKDYPTIFKKGDIGKTMADISKLHDKPFKKRKGDYLNDTAHEITLLPLEQLSDIFSEPKGQIRDIEENQYAAHGDDLTAANTRMILSGGDIQGKAVKPDGIRTFAKGGKVQMGKAGDLLESAGKFGPAVTSGLDLAAALVSGPETVDYGSASFTPAKVNHIDARAGVNRVRRTAANAQAKLRRFNPEGYLAQSANLFANEADAVTDVAGNVQAYNAQASNRANLLDAQNATRTNLFNKQISIQEENANALNRAAHQARISGDLANIGTMFGEMARDKKLSTADQEKHDSILKYYRERDKQMFGSPDASSQSVPRDQQLIPMGYNMYGETAPENGLIPEAKNNLYQGSIELPYPQSLKDYQWNKGGSLTHRLRLRNLNTR